MERIVGRDRLVGTVGGGYELVRRPLGNGHYEGVVRPLVTWHVAGELSDVAYELYLEAREASEAERKQANLERAANRAKTRVRHLCKAAGVDTMLTLTYRENMTDWALLKKHVKEFNRRMTRLIPGWFYVAAYERQQRGALHVHMAVHRLQPTMQHARGVKVKSYSVVQAVWRGVVGELGGCAHIKPRKCRRAPSRIASYLSKYMTKAFADGDAWSNRFSSSKGVAVPKPERIRFVGYSMVDMITLAYADMPYGHSQQLNCRYDRFGDRFWYVLDTNILESWRPSWAEAAAA